jgi:hypothetical protein
MNPGNLPTVATYLVLFILACWLVIYVKGRWWLKLMVILALPAFGILDWRSRESGRGYPTWEAMPEKGQFHWAVVEEPDPQRNPNGAIYIWLLPFPGKGAKPINPLAYEPPRGEPRAYRLPYSKELHQAVEGAKGKVRQGKIVIMDKNKKGQGGNDGEGGPGQGQGNGQGRKNGQGRPGNGPQGRGNGIGGVEQTPHFYDLPPPTMPPKDRPRQEPQAPAPPEHQNPAD